MKKLFLLFITIILLSSCTENTRTKVYGGTMTIDIPKGNKVVNVTWKENQIWYLIREMKKDEEPETLVFTESSKFGIFEGTVLLKESK